MNKKVPVGIYPRDISNDWREKKCTYCKKDIKRQYYKYCQVNENVTQGSCFLSTLAKSHTRYLRLNEGLSLLDHNASELLGGWMFDLDLITDTLNELKLLLYHFFIMKGASSCTMATPSGLLYSYMRCKRKLRRGCPSGLSCLRTHQCFLIFSEKLTPYTNQGYCNV